MSETSDLRAEIAGLRDLVTQAGLDAARLLAKAGIDANENESARRLQQLLLEELHHRVKNTLATVMAIATQSFRSSETIPQGLAAMENRIMALGRAHDLLLSANWAEANLTDVIIAAVAPFDSQKFAIEETDLVVGSAAVLPLTMSLNELCTNATKYGALSSAGRIGITFARDEKRFKLTWTESGGPVVKQPTRQSFGTRLMNQLAGQLHGHAALRYEPNGVVYELDIPMSEFGASIHN